VPVKDIGREWITAREAAQLLSVHPKTVQRACRRGVIRAELLSGTWLIARVGLEEALQGVLRDAPALRPELIDRTNKGRPRKRRASMRSSRTTATVDQTNKGRPRKRRASMRSSRTTTTVE
jgi:excisionase family DNA binding protein